MLCLWLNDQGEDYYVSKTFFREIDVEMKRFGEFTASHLCCRPRPLSRFGEWKSADVKKFVLSHSVRISESNVYETLPQAGET